MELADWLAGRAACQVEVTWADGQLGLVRQVQLTERETLVGIFPA